MSFQIIVVIVAIIVLILLLTIFGYSMYAANQNVNFPPINNACPDYWTLDASNNCVNTLRLKNYIDAVITSQPTGMSDSDYAAHKAAQLYEIEKIKVV
jgi:hypothetical protein